MHYDLLLHFPLCPCLYVYQPLHMYLPGTLAVLAVRQQADFPNGHGPAYGLPLAMLLDLLDVLLLLEVVLHGDRLGHTETVRHHLLILVTEQGQVLLVLREVCIDKGEH